MFAPIFAYLIVSIVCAVTAGLHVGIKPALCTIAASLISLIAAGALKFGVLWGTGAQRVGTPIIALLLLALAYWLGSGFSVVLFGLVLSGQAWAVVGAVIGLLFVNRQLAT
jgi:hypothetical protein